MGDMYEELPEELRKRLADLDQPHLFVPPDVDQAVLEAARQRFAELRRKRRPLKRWAWWLGPVAAAALLGLIVWAVDPFGTAHAPPHATADQAKPVTILDAFVLARRRAAGDRSISQSEIDRLALQAVLLAQTTAEKEDAI